MTDLRILAESYFDGHAVREAGPYGITVRDGLIVSIEALQLPAAAAAFRDRARLRCAFLMPGLVEAHCHLFLEGQERDTARRAAYLKSGFGDMLAVAHRNAAANLASGVTLLRDAGDRHGVNHATRSAVSSPEIRSPGFAINSLGRYGSFMARSVSDRGDVRALVGAAAMGADDLKIILTGIIDFAAGRVAGAPQFDLPTLAEIVAAAREHGLRTFAHCSGREGLALAVAAGVDSIEHGFFMDEEILDGMAARDISWVPTFAPVQFQWREPQHCGWDQQTVGNLRGILDDHAHHVRLAVDRGIAVIPGSDAGSHGVAHGTGLIDELLTLRDCGVPLENVLAASTSLPRARWGAESADVAPRNPVNVVGYGRSPLAHPDTLRTPAFVCHRGAVHEYS